MMAKSQGVLVTGAGQSVGRAMAEKFSARGDRVHICDIDEALLATVIAADPKISGTVCDVADETQVKQLFAAARAAIGTVDVLINTVGIAGPRGPIQSLSFAEWRATLAANLDSMFLTIREAVPAMQQNRHGVIINFSSMSTKTVMPFRSPYVASKAGVEGLTRSLARELGPHKIRVNAILPGAIDNQRLKNVLSRIAEQDGRRLDEVEAESLQFVSMRTKIQPDEIADMVLFLCSDAALHVTGQMIGVDGNMEWES
jgi:NAD(P)-dependent dehydrogenase (short-subunit alcohol dehydrogenase family)